MFSFEHEKKHFDGLKLRAKNITLEGGNMVSNWVNNLFCKFNP